MRGLVTLTSTVLLAGAWSVSPSPPSSTLPPVSASPAPAVPTVAASEAGSPPRSLTPRAFAPAPFDAAAYVLKDQNVTAFLDARGVALAIVTPTFGWAVRWGLDGAAEVLPQPSAPQRARVSYFLGNDPSRWRGGLPTWGVLRWRNLRPGLDLELTPLEHGLHWSLFARAGAHRPATRFRYQGVQSLAVTEDGAALAIATPAGPLREERPRAFQTGADGLRRELPARYAAVVAEGPETFSYAVEVSGADPLLPLELDPGILWSGCVGGTGGSGNDEGRDIAVDRAGAFVINGRTTATTSLPASAGSYDTSIGLLQDALVAKFDATGLVWTTYLGGATSPGSETGEGIAVDAVGNVVTTGRTRSDDFPTTLGAWSRTHGGGPQAYDAYASKLSADGTTLLWSTFVGGNGDDWGMGVEVGASDAVYLVGWTGSSNFPANLQVGPTGRNRDCGTTGLDCDVYLTKLLADGSNYLWSALIGGSGDDHGYEVALDGVGGVYVVGATESNDFVGPIGGFRDAWLLRIDETSTPALSFLRGIGGDGNDQAFGVAASPAGGYVTGATSSSNFPADGGFRQLRTGTGTDAFVVHYSPSGARLWGTLLGGSSNDEGHGLTVDDAGVVFVAGMTSSADFPASGGFQTSYGGARDAGDAMVARLGSGSQLDWGSFLGGSGDDQAYDVALLGDDLVVSGFTTSANFPVDGGAPYLSGTDLFAVRLSLAATSPSDDGGSADAGQPDAGGINVDAGQPDDGGVNPVDAGQPDDGGVNPVDAGQPDDGGVNPDDAGTSDAGTKPDDGGTSDAGTSDAGTKPDDGGTSDAGIKPDDGGTADAGIPPDDGGVADAGPAVDAGLLSDGGAPFRIASQPPLGASCRSAWSYAPAAQGPRASWALLERPEGMTLEPATGVLHWTPSVRQGGDHAVALEARAPGEVDVQRFTLTVECRSDLRLGTGCGCTSGPGAAALWLGLLAAGLRLGASRTRRRR